MQVFLTGGTGYIGRQILRDLIAAGHGVRALVRKESLADIPGEVRPSIAAIEGDILDASSLIDAMKGCAAVIHLPGLIREYPRKGITFRRVQFEGAKNVIDEACRCGVRRFILMSANGVRPDAATEYHKTKWMAEEYLHATTLDWTIFRPSVVVGNEDEGYDNFIRAIIGQLAMLPLIVPIPGNGHYMFQPVSIRNLSEAFVRSLDSHIAIGKMYEAGGIERMTYLDIVRSVARRTGRKKMYVRQPMWLLELFARMLGRFSFFPVTADQLRMMSEGNVTTHEQEMYGDFAIEPIRFEDALKLPAGDGE